MGSFKSEPTSTDNERPETTTPDAEQRQYMACKKCLAQRDLLRNLLLTEKQHRRMPRYMRNKRNRRIGSHLVDWLVKNSIANQLETETLHLSVSFVDRFLSRTVVKSAKVKVVGAAALCNAAMHDERHGKLKFRKDDIYTKKELKRQKVIMLKALGWDLNTPTACGFINSIAALCKWPDKLRFLALYIAELSVMNGAAFMRYLPSRMASASIALARYTLGMEMWTQQLEEITTHKLKDIRAVIRKLAFTYKTAKRLESRSVRVKYFRKKYQDVATIEAIDLPRVHLNELCLQYANRPLQTAKTICYCKR